MTKIFRLPNGITCVCDERPGTGTVAMGVQFKTGSASEAPEENGLTNLMQEATQGGTTTRSRARIASDFETRGNALSSVTGPDATFFSTEVLARDAEGAFDVLADVLRHPVFDPEETRKMQNQVAQSIRKGGQSPITAASKKFLETALGGASYGLAPAGTEDLVKSFTPEQVKGKYAEMLRDPSGIIVSFAGDITFAQACALTEKHFGDLAPVAAAAAAPKAAFTGGDYREDNDNKQLNLFLGFKAPGRDDPDRYAALMLQEALSGGMSSPLFQEIREKRGLVYTVQASYKPLPGDGTFFIYAGTGKGNAGELFKTAFALLGGTAKDGFGAAEMERARDRLLRKAKVADEEAGKSMAGNAAMIAQFGRLVPLEEVEAKLRQVTADDLRRVCANMLKEDNYALSAVGPLATLPPPAEIKALMQESLQGVTIPEKTPQAPVLSAAFAAAAKMEETAAVPRITVLSNGMKVITVERPGTLSCGAWVGAGSDHETPALSGATHMNEHMMFKGTPSYLPGTIDKIVEGELHGSLNAYTTRDKTCYYFYNLLPEALQEIVKISGEMVFKALINQQEFDGKTVMGPDGVPVKAKGERDVVIEELRKGNDNVGRRTMNLAMAAAYPDQPHGWDVLGPESGLRALDTAQLRAYRDEFYTPNNVIFCAVGPVRHEDFVAAVEKQFGDLKPGPIAPLPQPVYKGGTVALEADTAKLCNVMLAADGVPVTDPDSQAYAALGIILGKGFASRLYQKVVSELELTAGVEAGTNDYRNSGTFVMVAQTEAAKVKPLINAIYAECRDVAQNLTEADLARAKTVMEMSDLKKLETARDACDEIACTVQAFGRIISPAEISASIQKLTVDDIKRVAAKILAQNPTAAMVVPPGTDPALLPTHEEVTSMRDGKYKPPGAAPKRDIPGAGR